MLAVTRLSGPLLFVQSKRARFSPNDDHPEGQNRQRRIFFEICVLKPV